MAAGRRLDRRGAAPAELSMVPEGAAADEGPVHLPVLADELVELLARVHGEGLDGWVVDGTVGAGGHAARVLERFPRARLLGSDQDPEILEVARACLAPFGERVELVHGRISGLCREVRKRRLDAPLAWVLDLGASSLQLDRAERGFSFQLDGPLDMRMDPARDRTAADVVNDWDELDLADLLFYEGGEPRARQIARAICDSRRRAPFRRTGALADLVVRTVGRSGRLHPATRTFQALRRAVNEEGDELLAGLAAAELCLAGGGVLAVIAFHSGEDGEVKRFLQTGEREGRWNVLSKKPVRPQREEERRNVRARSARLRGAVRTREADPVRGATRDASARTLAGRPDDEGSGDERGGPA